MTRTGPELPQGEADFFEALSAALDGLGRGYIAVVAAADGGSPVLLSNLAPAVAAGVLREVLQKLERGDTEAVGPEAG